MKVDDLKRDYERAVKKRQEVAQKAREAEFDKQIGELEGELERFAATQAATSRDIEDALRVAELRVRAGTADQRKRVAGLRERYKTVVADRRLDRCEVLDLSTITQQLRDKKWLKPDQPLVPKDCFPIPPVGASAPSVRFRVGECTVFVQRPGALSAVFRKFRKPAGMSIRVEYRAPDSAGFDDLMKCTLDPRRKLLIWAMEPHAVRRHSEALKRFTILVFDPKSATLYRCRRERWADAGPRTLGVCFRIEGAANQPLRWEWQREPQNLTVHYSWPSALMVRHQMYKKGTPVACNSSELPTAHDDPHTRRLPLTWDVGGKRGKGGKKVTFSVHFKLTGEQETQSSRGLRIELYPDTIVKEIVEARRKQREISRCDQEGAPKKAKLGRFEEDKRTLEATKTEFERNKSKVPQWILRELREGMRKIAGLEREIAELDKRRNDCLPSIKAARVLMEDTQKLFRATATGHSAVGPVIIEDPWGHAVGSLRLDIRVE